VSSTPSHPQAVPPDDFVSTEELIRRSGARPFTSVEDLPGEDPFGSDREYAEFLDDLYRSRRAGVA
jgi:hypothetical protein